MAKRAACSAAERQQAVAAALQLLLPSPLFSRSLRIACYFAQDAEFDCLPIIEAIWDRHKKCYLPIVAPLPNAGLQFALYQPNDNLRLNCYKILEPENEEHVPLEQLDLVLVPLVGFDLQGNRLGMGGGFYDRTFSFLAEKGSEKKPYLLGLAYELQQVEHLAADAWDIKLNGVLTEKKFYSFDH